MAIRIVSAESAPKQTKQPKEETKAAAKPLSFEAVERILERVIENGDLPNMDNDCELIEWDKLPDGTTVGVVENTETGVRYHYTVCPNTFKPKNLGPVDK